MNRDRHHRATKARTLAVVQFFPGEDVTDNQIRITAHFPALSTFVLSQRMLNQPRMGQAPPGDKSKDTGATSGSNGAGGKAGVKGKGVNAGNAGSAGVGGGGGTPRSLVAMPPPASKTVLGEAAAAQTVPGDAGGGAEAKGGEGPADDSPASKMEVEGAGGAGGGGVEAGGEGAGGEGGGDGGDKMAEG